MTKMNGKAPKRRVLMVGVPPALVVDVMEEGEVAEVRIQPCAQLFPEHERHHATNPFDWVITVAPAKASLWPEQLQEHGGHHLHIDSQIRNTGDVKVVVGRVLKAILPELSGAATGDVYPAPA